MTAGSSTTQDQAVVLSADEVTAIRAEAVDLGAPQAPTEVARPDGQPGYEERLKGAELADPDDEPIPFRLREGDQPLPTEGDGPVIHELVVADVMNRLALGVRRYGQPLRAHNGRSFLRDAYEELLDLCAYMRGAIEEEEARLRAAEDAAVPAPPALRNGNVVVVEGAAWQWRDRQWHPLITDEDYASLDPTQLAAIREHAGDLIPAPRT